MLSFTEENYLKAIYTLSESSSHFETSTNEIAERLNTKPPTVSDMLRKLTFVACGLCCSLITIGQVNKDSKQIQKDTSNPQHKYLQEVGTMNIFIVFNDEIVTPATTGTILKGITRASAIEILRDNGHTVNERDISIEEVLERYEKDELLEVFGTGTAALVANVEEIRYKDRVYQLPLEWDLSASIRDEINGMRYGKIADKRGWTVPVHDHSEITA